MQDKEVQKFMKAYQKSKTGDIKEVALLMKKFADKAVEKMRKKSDDGEGSWEDVETEQQEEVQPSTSKRAASKGQNEAKAPTTDDAES